MAKVQEIYALTKGLMFEKGSSAVYDDYVIPNLNVILMDLFNENNVCRVFNGKNKLASPQQVTSLTDTLVYEDEYVLKVIPLGLAASFFIDDDLQKWSIFDTKYNNARVLSQKLVDLEEYEDAS